MASLTNRFKYDVFLSFKGEDTRCGFTGNLWKALDNKGIKAFIDDEDLRKGEEITPSLMNAIEDSNIAIVVLSKNYASSSFCLQELSTIFDSIKDKDRCVLPIFYEVDPSNVRKLKNTYAEAMAIHEMRFNSNMLQKWKNVLHRVANLSGFHYKGDEYEYCLIDRIVQQVSREILPVTLYVSENLVGLKHQKKNVISLLKDESEHAIHMVGIYGIGGIGKTTLALEVYNSISHQFEGSCFLEKVKESSNKNGLVNLQKILLSQIVGEKNIEITSVRQGISMLQQRLHKKKVLLLLDDVDDKEQLEAIAGSSDWFNSGSRILITTRDKRLLACHGVERTYEVNGLNDEDAFELVMLNAFKNKVSLTYKDILRAKWQKWHRRQKILNEFHKLKDIETDDVFSGYVHVLNRVITYASGLPLALEVIGSHLFDKTIEQCEAELDRYERIPDKTIQKTLKLSFDTLQKEEKSVFLDIACCFKGYSLTKVEQILHAHYGNIMKTHISVLAEKSLIKISVSGNVTLHDLVEDMGKEIVRLESPEDPGKRSRLWAFEDITQILEEHTGTSEIEIIVLRPSFENLFYLRFQRKYVDEAFKKMKNLRTLIIKNDNYLFPCTKHLPNSLRVFEGRLYGLPSSFYPKKLTICNIGFSFSTSIEGKDFFKKKFENMRVLNFDDCESLKQTPDVSGLQNLEELSFRSCENLITIDQSITLLWKLKILRVINCKKIKSIPPLMLDSLEELDFSICHSLESFPHVKDWSTDKLKIMSVENWVKSIPPLKYTSLETLNISYCTRLESFPLVVDEFLGKIKLLHVEHCHNLKSIPPLKLTSLVELHLSHCYSLERFPHVVDSGKLQNLIVEHCHNLKSIPPLKLTSLVKLHLSHCYSLKRFPLEVDRFLGKLQNMVFEHCHNLKSIPPFKLNSLLDLNLSHCYSLKSFPRMVDNLLDELVNLNIEYCIMLRRFPPLKLPSLKKFNLIYCLSLENFPEILGEMRNKPTFELYGTLIKELSMSKLAEFTIKAEEKVCLMQSSHVTYLSTSLILANVKELYLGGCKFKVLPKSMGKFHLLWKLVLDDCEELQEIQVIPPCLKLLSALNCKSLTSSCKSKLLNQELHEAGNTLFRLPLAKIPKWFDHQYGPGLSISLWFRNKFPAIVLCVVSRVTSYGAPMKVIINKKTKFNFDTDDIIISIRMYHLHIFHLQMEERYGNMDKELVENRWNHAEINFNMPFMNSGIHVLKEKSSMDDIQFTNPENDANIGLHP